MMISKALIIDEPWISKILNGEKDWEMRSSMTSHRGLFGLIKKGSGKIFGIANLTGVSGPYDSKGLKKAAGHHQVGSQRYNDPAYKWRFAWELSNIQRLDKPVDYIHKSGAVIWVKLEEKSIKSITRQISNDTTTMIERKNVQMNTGAENETDSESSAITSIEITLTQGNINNYHFYIPRNTRLFPKDSWGGKNKSEAGRHVTVHFKGAGAPVQTDIDGSKRLFRSRGPVRVFYELYKLKAGDTVKVSKVGEREFSVIPGARG
jgi:hypothetical protein